MLPASSPVYTSATIPCAELDRRARLSPDPPDGVVDALVSFQFRADKCNKHLKARMAMYMAEEGIASAPQPFFARYPRFTNWS